MKRLFNIKTILIIFTGILISGVSVSAAIKLSSLEVNYDNKESKLSSNDVQTAIDELNTKINEKIEKVKNNCPADQICAKTWNFDYTGGEQVFIVPETGVYKLETWGAQGGEPDYGGYGGYSIGEITEKKGDIIYINVGGAGTESNPDSFSGGGYNGGGDGARLPLDQSNSIRYGGGGATHMAKISGVLSSLSTKKESIIMISGGGGGGKSNEDEITRYGGSAGGVIGNSAYNSEKNSKVAAGTGGTQTAGGIGGESSLYGFAQNGFFGQGGNGNSHSPGGGGGYYGGGGGTRDIMDGAGGGGSGYIGNSLLTNKAMYCYNCQESNEQSTKTISTTNVSSTPTSGYAKIGNGYARITYYLE